MKRLLSCLLASVAVVANPAMAAARQEFSFGVIFAAHQPADETALRDAIEASNEENLAFVVMSGVKPANEPCSDRVYEESKQVLESAKHGLIVSLAASDWAECKGEDGKPAALGRLNRLRELLFVDDYSAGSTRIPVVRQSTTLKFRSYAENMRWQVGNVMFATINLPANNNHYLPAAGRNSEFEDRLVANRDWLHRIFVSAVQKRSSAIVLFCDGNPLSSSSGGSRSRDGFAEIRRHILAMAGKFPGRVLLVHRQGGGAAQPVIAWSGKLGEVSGTGLARLRVSPSIPELFAIEPEQTQASSRHRGLQAAR